MRFEIYKDKGGEWRWRLMAANNRIIADSGEGYTHKQHCQEMVTSIQKDAPKATVAEAATGAEAHH